MFRRPRPDLPPPAPGVVVGTLAAHEHVVVRPDGSTDPGGEWVVGDADGWHRAADRPSATSQRLVDGLPIVETSLRVPGGQVVQRVWCVTDGGAELVVLEVENRSKEAVSVALVADDPAGVVPARRPARTCPPDASPFPLDHGVALVWPLAHTASLRVVVVLTGDWFGDPDVLPDAEAVARGWRAHLDAGARLSWPDPGLEAALITARASLLVRGAQWRVPAEAASVAAALGAWGHHDAALAPIEVLLDTQRADGSFDRDEPAATATAIAAWATHVRSTGDASVATRLAEPTAKAAHRLGKQRRRTSPPPWFVVAQYDAASLLDRADQPAAADLCRSRAAAPTPPPAVVLADLQGLAPTAGSVDLRSATTLLDAAHRFLVDDTVPGTVHVMPAWPDEWLGAGLEVHRLPTRAGSLSFAVRWHGARPALLWELDGPAPVVLTVGLDPSWRATDPAGEALLPPVEPPGGLPGVLAPLTGAATPVDEAPDDGVSFD